MVRRKWERGERERGTFAVLEFRPLNGSSFS
jgi:hypothetical protein